MITEAQRIFRSDKIGGSDVSSIRGTCKYAGPASVQRRIQGIDADRGIEQLYNPVLEFGNRLEPLITTVFAENHPELLVMTLEDAHANGLLEKLPGFRGVVHVLADGSISVTHPEYDFMVMNVDAIVISKRNPDLWGILEIKTASEYMASDWGQTGTDAVPNYHRDQPVYYAGGLGGVMIYVAAMIGLRDYREYRLQYTSEEYEELIGDLAWFHFNHIVLGMPVVSVADVDNHSYLVTHESKSATPDVVELMRVRKALDESMKPLKKERETVDKKIKAFLGNASCLVDQNGEVLYKVTESDTSVFDEGEFKRDYPELFGRYLRSNCSRRISTGSAYDHLSPLTRGNISTNAA